MKIRESTLRLTVMANLCAIAVVGRIYLSGIGGFQPVTFIVIITALFMGLKYSMAIAAISTIITNIFLGWGIWTFYQIFSWCAIALLSMLFVKFRDKLVVVSVWSFVSGFVYGFIVSLWAYLFVEAPAGFFIYWIAGLSHDFVHASGNLIFCWTMYPLFVFLLKKLKILK